MLDHAGADWGELDIAVTGQDVVLLLGKARAKSTLSEGATATIGSIHVLDVALAD